MTEENGIAPPGGQPWLTEALQIAGIVRDEPGISWKDLLMRCTINLELKHFERALVVALKTKLIDADFFVPEQDEAETPEDEHEIVDDNTKPDVETEADSEATSTQGGGGYHIIVTTLSTAVKLLLDTNIKRIEGHESVSVLPTLRQMFQTVLDAEARYKDRQQSMRQLYAEFEEGIRESKKQEARLKLEYERSKAALDEALRKRAETPEVKVTLPEVTEHEVSERSWKPIEIDIMSEGDPDEE